jgi:hypothetical protein
MKIQTNIHRIVSVVIEPHVTPTILGDTHPGHLQNSPSIVGLPSKSSTVEKRDASARA